jgi:hypothetical protein
LSPNQQKKSSTGLLNIIRRSGKNYRRRSSVITNNMEFS